LIALALQQKSGTTATAAIKTRKITSNDDDEMRSARDFTGGRYYEVNSTLTAQLPFVSI
jgi:hypothetical protein